MIRKPKRIDHPQPRDTRGGPPASLEDLPEASVVINRRGIVIECNAAAERMFGYRREELLDRNIKLLMPPPYHEEHDDYIERYLRTGQARIIGKSREVRAKRKDGSDFPVELAVIEVSGGPEVTFRGTIRDISERRLTETALAQGALDERHRISRELHDSVGQELSALALSARMMTYRLKPILPDEAVRCEEFGGRLQETIRRLRDVIENLAPLGLEGQGLADALARLAETTRERHGISCEFQCEDGAHVADSGTALQLYQIAQEAVHNAVKQWATRTCRVRLARHGGGIILSIADDGKGIKGDSANPKGGQGLRIMQYRADAIGASLRIESEPGKGTRVQCIYQPRAGNGPPPLTRQASP
ncbi:PAS domain S-box protein [Candidatus Sumerlaeota bacterium]|nr:PAS domain S-box protein [Candidatus Sumerlaeota bacterium]